MAHRERFIVNNADTYGILLFHQSVVRDFHLRGSELIFIIRCEPGWGALILITVG